MEFILGTAFGLGIWAIIDVLIVMFNKNKGEDKWTKKS
jgi:hypothetical protein